MTKTIKSQTNKKNREGVGVGGGGRVEELVGKTQNLIFVEAVQGSFWCFLCGFSHLFFFFFFFSQLGEKDTPPLRKRKKERESEKGCVGGKKRSNTEMSYDPPSEKSKFPRRL